MYLASAVKVFVCVLLTLVADLTVSGAPSDDVDLFLIGKTGHGKSSSGNAILGREAFEVSDSSESETYVVQVGWARRFGRVIKVVDGPGVCETRLARGEAAKKMTKDMSQGIVQCPQGFHAMVLVLKYGNRFTEEELGSIETLKSIFGPDFVRDFVVIIFTHGELFEMNNRKHPERTFGDWMKGQTGAMKTLLTECQYRAVLFSNMSPEKNEEQLQNLLSVVDGLKSKGVRYTSELFKKAAEAREQLIIKENAPELREKIQAKLDLLIDGVEKVKMQTDLNDEVRAMIDQLKEDAQDLAAEIAVQDKGTGVLDSLKQVLVNVARSIGSHEEALRQKGDKEKYEAALVQAQKDYENSLAQMRREVEKARKKRGFFKRIVEAVVSFVDAFDALSKGEL